MRHFCGSTSKQPHDFIGFINLKILAPVAGFRPEQPDFVSNRFQQYKCPIRSGICFSQQINTHERTF